MHLHERIREGRHRRGWSQAEMAKLGGFDQSVISQFETGAREPGARNIARLATLLDVSADWLLGLRSWGARADSGSPASGGVVGSNVAG